MWWCRTCEFSTARYSSTQTRPPAMAASVPPHATDIDAAGEASAGGSGAVGPTPTPHKALSHLPDTLRRWRGRARWAQVTGAGRRDIEHSTVSCTQHTQTRSIHLGSVSDRAELQEHPGTVLPATCGMSAHRLQLKRSVSYLLWVLDWNSNFERCWEITSGLFYFTQRRD